MLALVSCVFLLLQLLLLLVFLVKWTFESYRKYVECTFVSVQFASASAAVLLLLLLLLILLLVPNNNGHNAHRAPSHSPPGKCL